MRRSYFLLAALSLVACDKSGIHPLGEARDHLGPCNGPTTTWLRSTDLGTELFLIGEATEGTDGLPVPGCFGRAFVSHDSSTRMTFGTYEDDGSGTGGTFVSTSEYKFDYEVDKPILKREGSSGMELDPPITHPLTMSTDGAELLLTYLGETRRLTEMPDLVDSLDPTTQDGAEQIFCLFNLPLLTSQVRIGGFGGTGMTGYLDAVTPFLGAIRNYVTVGVKDIVYVDFADLTGISHDGFIHNEVNLMGDGDMRGVLAFRMEGRTTMVAGSVDYAELLVRNGVAGAGQDSITTEEGGTFPISYTFAANLDLRAVLPVSTP